MDIGHNHGLLSHPIPTMENSDNIVGVSDQYWTNPLITSTDGDNWHSTHLTSHILPVQISQENKCSFKVSVHLEHDTVVFQMKGYLIHIAAKTNTLNHSYFIDCWEQTNEHMKKSTLQKE